MPLFVIYTESDRNESCPQKMIGTATCREMIDVVVPMRQKLRKAIKNGCGQEVREAAEGVRKVFVQNVETEEVVAMTSDEWQDALNADTYGEDWKSIMERASQYL